MQLTWAERRIIDMKQKWAEEYELRKKAKKRIAQLEAMNGVGNTTDLLELRRKLEHVDVEKDAALLWLSEAKEKAGLAEQRTEHLAEELRAAQNANEQLVKERDGARDATGGGDQTILDHLHTTITVRDTKIEQLVKKYDDFTLEHFKLLKQANRDGEELAVFQEKNKVQNRELKELRARFACIETNRDWYVLFIAYKCVLLLIKYSHNSCYHRFKKENIRLSNEVDTQRANITKLNAQVKDLQKTPKTDVTELKAKVTSLTNESKSHRTGISTLQKKVNKLNYDIGFFITHLDLAEANFRVFNCRHTNYKKIPTGEASTRKHTAGSIATEYYNDWNKDPAFIREYKDARSGLVGHHRKHEQAGEGWAISAQTIKAELEKVDKIRGVKVKYG
jgi:hypothetical protein